MISTPLKSYPNMNSFHRLLLVAAFGVSGLALGGAEPVPQPLVFFHFNEGAGNASAPQDSEVTAELIFDDPSTGPLSLFSASGDGLSGKPGDYALDIGKTTQAMGVAGGSGGVAHMKTEKTALGALASFTVAGWFKAASQLDGGARLVEYTDPLIGGFLLMAGRGTLVLSVNKQQTASPRNEGNFYRQTNEWVFFAVTYNGNQKADNVVFYGGTPTSEPVVVGVASNETGPVAALNRYGALVIGNNAGGIRPFHGMLDNVALYGSQDNESGALTGEQIKEIYRSSQTSPLGPVTPPAETSPKKSAAVPGAVPSAPAPAAPSPEAGKFQIALIGDSTVCNYPDDSPLRGWGQLLPEFLIPEAKVLNEARGGMSTKSFPPAQWQRVLRAKPRFVFIQFGHNDSHDPGRPESTNAATDYQTNLKRFIAEARQAGITPILVTPPHRRQFSNGKVSHDLDAYVSAMKSVGEATHTPVVDLYGKSGALLESLGENGSAGITVNRLANPESLQEDRTHFTQEGARQLAKIVVSDFPAADPGLTKLLRP